MKRRYEKRFPIVGLDFAPEKEDDVDIVEIDDDMNREPAAKRLKTIANMTQCKLCLNYFDNPIYLASHNCCRIKQLQYTCNICQRKGFHELVVLR